MIAKCLITSSISYNWVRRKINVRDGNVLWFGGIGTKFLWTEESTQAKLSCRRPRAWRACLILKVNTDLVRGCPFLKRKNGPGSVPLAAMYWRLAVTGHKEHTVFPIYTSTPFPSWSIFEVNFECLWIFCTVYCHVPPYEVFRRVKASYCRQCYLPCSGEAEKANGCCCPEH